MLRFCFVLSLLLLAAENFAVDSKNIPWNQKKRVALLVGVNQYTDTTSLKFPVSDSKKMKTILEKVGYFDHIEILNDEEGLRDKTKLPTKENIEGMFKALIDSKPDTILFYFSGHGLIDGEKNNAIAPSDTKVSNDFKKVENIINLDELAKQVDTSIEQGIFLIDACRSPLPKGQKIVLDNSDLSQESKKSNSSNIPTITIKKKLPFSKELLREDVENARGVSILIGTSPDNTSLEDETLESGIFTYYMIKGLEGGILNETIEEYVTISSLRSFIDKKFIANREEDISVLEDILNNTKPDSERYSQVKNRIVEAKNRLPQRTYLIAPARGVTGDPLISFGRPNWNHIVERVKYIDDDGVIIYAKNHLEEGIRKSYMNFFSKQESTGKFYPDDLDGVGKMKFDYDANFFEAIQYDKEGREIFTHKLEYDSDKKNWEYSGFIPKSDIDAKFEKKIFNQFGNILNKSLFQLDSEKGKLIPIGGIQYSYNASGKITKELSTVLNREYSKKYTYNGKGLLTSIKIFGFDSEKKEMIPFEDENGINEYKFFYDLNGNQIKEEYYNSRGYLQEDLNNIAYKNYSYDKSGNKIREEAFRSNHNPLTKEGISSILYKYDANKRVIEKSFFTEIEIENKKRKIKQTDDAGVHLYRYSYDSECLRDRTIAIIRKKKFYILDSDWQVNATTSENCYKQIQMIGKSGEPVPSRLGASRIEFVHDGGREIFKRYLNNSGKFLYASVPYKTYYANRFDENGNHIERDLRLISGELIENQDGFAGIHYKHDKEGREIEMSYIGAKGQLVRGIRGVARYVYQYNRNGRLISVEMFDSKGNYTAEDSGSSITKEVYKYNDKDQHIQTEYYGANGKLASNGGYAKEKLEYDKFGNLILKEEYNDKNKILSTEKNKYNQFGQLIRHEILDEKNNITYWVDYQYDTDNRLIQVDKSHETTKYIYQDKFHYREEKYTSDKSPIFPIIHYELNKDYKVISKTFQYALEKNAVSPNNKLYQIRYEFDKNGNMILEESLDAFGNLINPKASFEAARKIFRYDDGNNKIAETYFNDDGSLSNTISQDWVSYARSRIVYDRECANAFRKKEHNKSNLEIDNLLRDSSGCEIFRSMHKASGELLQRYFKDRVNNEFLSIEKINPKGYINVGGERGIPKDKYFQVFENPDGKSDSRRVRLELDRFHRPIEISFESSRLKK